jgi:hypothetical protein
LKEEEVFLAATVKKLRSQAPSAKATYVQACCCVNVKRTSITHLSHARIQLDSITLAFQGIGDWPKPSSRLMFKAKSTHYFNQIQSSFLQIEDFCVWLSSVQHRSRFNAAGLVWGNI